MTSSNGNIFRVTGNICAGNSPVSGEFPAQRPVTRSFRVFFDLRLNKRLSKQSRGWWFETPSRSLWRQRNVNMKHIYVSGPWKCPIWFLYRRFIHSVKSGEAICCHTPGSTLFQEVACCSTVPSHHQDQCWCIIKCVLQDSMTMILQDVLMYLKM